MVSLGSACETLWVYNLSFQNIGCFAKISRSLVKSLMVSLYFSSGSFSCSSSSRMGSSAEQSTAVPLPTNTQGAAFYWIKPIFIGLLECKSYRIREDSRSPCVIFFNLQTIFGAILSMRFDKNMSKSFLSGPCQNAPL